MLSSSLIPTVSRSHSLLTFSSRVEPLTWYGAEFETLRLTVIVPAAVLSFNGPDKDPS